ncbi:hypothetical protein NKG94_10400 [Micromonospora sp. M12]
MLWVTVTRSTTAVAPCTTCTLPPSMAERPLCSSRSRRVSSPPSRTVKNRNGAAWASGRSWRPRRRS